MQFDPRMAPRAGVKVATVICACRPLQLFEVFAPADGAFLLFADRPALHAGAGRFAVTEPLPPTTGVDMRVVF